MKKLFTLLFINILLFTYLFGQSDGPNYQPQNYPIHQFGNAYLDFVYNQARTNAPYLMETETHFNLGGCSEYNKNECSRNK